MNLENKIAVVTGGAQGIGRALCRRFAAEGARQVIVADVDAPGAASVAAEVGGLAIPTDVAREAEVRRLVDQTLERFGRIDLFCSNAGIYVPGGVEVPDDDWERIFAVNYKAHLYAARAVLPSMLRQGQGYLLNVVSAAGLLTHVESAPYAVTKHAALALAEWLAIAHGNDGILVSCVCPQGVLTRMLLGDGRQESFLKAEAVTPEQLADAVVEGIAEERFLILPHPEVAEFFRFKAADYDRWLRGMRRLRQKISDGQP